MSGNILFLSHDINPDGTLPIQISQRLERGVELYRDLGSTHLMLTGGYAQPEIPFTHAEAMFAGLPVDFNTDKVLMEDHALDTVGQAIFAHRDFYNACKDGGLLVVTHEYHIPRTKKIFEFVFDDKLELAYDAISNGKITINTPEKEAASTAAFEKTFDGVTPGDLPAILNALYANHPWYNHDLERFTR